MKTKLLYLFALAFTLGSCNILDVEPYDAIPAEEVLTSKKGLEGSLMGAYNVLQSASISTDALVFADLAADVFIAKGSKAEYREVSINDIQASNSYIEGIWNNSYDGINLVNHIINGIGGVQGITEEEKQYFLGQAHFLRAFHYFNLVRFFGEVPKRINPVSDASPETLNIGLSPQSEIYALIISDLELAENYLDGQQVVSSSFATAGAAKGLLAKVYLYTENWAGAVAKANEVLTMGYALETNFANIYDESLNSNEIIFKIDFFNSQEAANLLSNWLTPDGRFEVAVWKNAEKTATIFNDFDTNDLRRDISIHSKNEIDGLVYYCAKYDDVLNAKDHPIVLRLADIILIKAEALNEQTYVPDGEAFDELNKIRNRAGLPDYTSADLPNQQDFRRAIENERLFELVFEGNRLFDLRRTNRINDVVPDIGTLKEAGWYFPIPQSEVETNESIN